MAAIPALLIGPKLIADRQPASARPKRARSGHSRRALATTRRLGTPAAARTLLGVIRGLPSYLAFCLVVTTTAGALGTPVAVLLAFAACLGTCGLTWRSVQHAGSHANARPLREPLR